MLRLKCLGRALSLWVVGVTSVPLANAVENTWDYSVQVSATVQSSPPRVTLSWPQDTKGPVSSYTVYRKAPAATSWGTGTALAGSATSYADTNVTDGGAYEYRIIKAGSGYTGYGYIRSGLDAPLVDARGKIVLIVDNTMSGPLASELTRLQQDLTGDGWVVLRHDVSRSDSPPNIKALIKADYTADPANVKALFLFGHVPVPYSGQHSADGHADHIGAWPADVYYGDMDGAWTDSTVNYVQTLRPDAADNARTTNRPGDGKFDQNQPPSSVELEIGRVDLANLTNNDYWGIDAVFPSETEMLRRYLNKDHNFRHRVTNTARRALVGDYFGLFNGSAPAQAAFRNFAPLVGATNIRNLNIEYNDQKGVWIPAAAANDYLFAYGGAPSGYGAISALGSAGPSFGAPVAEFLSRDVRNVFTMFWGSYLGDWDHWDNVFRAPLANNYGLATVWSGRSHWFIHPLGMGETFGYAARLSQNNTGTYDGASGATYIALMGDPSLRIHPVVPVGSVNGSLSGSTVALTWTASGDSALVGYQVYRATSASGPYTRLTSAPIAGLTFNDPAGSATAVYMVRAIKRESSPSGSYLNASQGLFWSATGGATIPPPAPLPPTTSDTTPPAISMAAPLAGATTSGASVNVSANAFDNVGVLGVQFKLDGANLGFEDTTVPYGVTLNTTTLTNGPHTVTAVARDVAGLTATAAVVNFTVNNTTSGGTAGGAPPPANGTETVYFDDAIPGGSTGMTDGGDVWNWITSGPVPISGTKAHQSANVAGLHSHTFNWGGTMSVATGDRLYTYVYLDPASMPTQIMVSWCTDGWEHRAYWGANRISWGTNGTASRYYVGALPAPGQWVRLEIPASAVGIEGQSVRGMSFAQYDGRATWDRTGTVLAGSAPTTEPPPPTTEPPPTTPPTTTGTDFSWIDDALPAGATGYGTGGDAWNWITSGPTPISGAKAHQSANVPGLHSHSFNWGATMTVLTGDTLYAYVYLDPAAMPKEIMIGWSSDNWEHRAYWGANLISWGSNGTAGRFYAGALPPAGQWVRLEIPASAVGLEGHVVKAMTFAQFDGRATWDNSGTAAFGSTTPPPAEPTPTEPPPTTTTPPPTTTTPPTAGDVAWIDDALPSGATSLVSGGDAWNWITSGPAPISGTKAHQSTLQAGEHSHSFNWGATMSVAAGDKLYAYVYLDPANLPVEIMLSWGSDNWEHRAYWGADRIGWGTANTPGRYRAGALPPAGQWVRLEVPASAVGLEGHTVRAMSFTQFDGRATWDAAGKSDGAAVTPPPPDPVVTPPPTTTPSVETFVWVDDSVPAGATAMGVGAETWNWVTANPAPYSGTRAHQSIVAAGLHEHYFAWGAPMSVYPGDKLFTYVYLDPANPPTEIMLSWNSGTWEHRAYWGADRITYGQFNTAGRYYAGPLPATGQWVKLEVPASAIGLEGATVTAMGFTTFDGRVTFDKTGK